ncbi:MAG: hypothetical protein Q9160_004033 [Pyrenula sp. 1 TL-2023]
MCAQFTHSQASPASFAYVKYPLVPETQPSQKPEVLAISPYPPATSPLRQRILEASEGLRSISKRKRKPFAQGKWLAANRASQLEEAAPESRQEILDSKMPKHLAIIETQRPARTFSANNDHPSKNAMDSICLNSTADGVGPFTVDRYIERSEHAAGQHISVAKNIHSKSARTEEHRRSPSGLIGIEEDDAWFNVHNHIGANGKAQNSDVPAVQPGWVEETTYPQGEKENWSPEESHKVRDDDAMSERSGSTEATNSEDEFPMDEGILEEAAIQSEWLDRDVQRYDESNGSPLDAEYSIPQSPTTSEEFDCSSDILADDLLPAEMALANSLSTDNGSTKFGVLGSTPMTPPPRLKGSETLVYATSSPVKEDRPYSTICQPLSPDSPSGITSLEANEGIWEDGTITESSIVLSTPLRRERQSTQLTVTTVAVDHAEDLSKSHQTNSVSGSDPGEDMYSPLAPFARSSFAEPMSRQSLLPSATPEIRMLTYFRTPAMLKALSSTSSPTTRILLEAYCLVCASARQGCIQRFVFADLFFSDTCPTLNGTYKGWQGSELWEHDSGVFLADSIQSSPKMCRAIITPSPGNGGPKGMADKGKGPIERGQSIEVQVLNIWEANWEDVRFVKGIVDA